MFRRKSSPNDEKLPFNNTFGKLERISDDWRAATQAKILGDTDTYYNCLEAIYIEIFPHLNVEEQKAVFKRLRDIERFLDTSRVPTGYEQLKSLNRRKGSNLCDLLATSLSSLCFKYNLEWFDIAAYNKERANAEPVMRG
jgi:hypothetical protein